MLSWSSFSFSTKALAVFFGVVMLCKIVEMFCWIVDEIGGLIANIRKRFSARRERRNLARLAEKQVILGKKDVLNIAEDPRVRDHLRKVSEDLYNQGSSAERHSPHLRVVMPITKDRR